MTDEINRPPGDPEDWEPPEWRLQQKAWAELSDIDRRRLEPLTNERDENGEKTWKQTLEDDPDDPTWTEYWMRTVDPRDERDDVRLARWPKSFVEAEQRRAEDLAAIDAEHEED